VNARQLAIVWVIALALVAGFLVAPKWLADRAEPAATDDIVVIGSSLMAHAFPVEAGGATSLLGDGRSHVRIASSRMGEAELLRRFEEAIDRRSPLVFLEANPLIFDLAHSAGQRPCDGWTNWMRNFLGVEQTRVADAYRRILDRPRALDYPGDPPTLMSAHRLDPAQVRLVYPIRLRPMCDEAAFKAAVERARAQGTRVVLVLPPRSPDGDRLMGPGVPTEIRRRATALAARLDAELFAPPDQWQNAEFVDTAHLNIAGRRHFLNALRHWWAEPG
jgi:hypothetical protein